MKIIFLDIDGVLNGYNIWNLCGWEIVKCTHIKFLINWYKKITGLCEIHERKVKLLAKIIQTTGAKVVLSNSWRKFYFDKLYINMNKTERSLCDLFDYYNLEIYDKTPVSDDNRRDKEIITYLSKHEDEVESFIILDDENEHMLNFWNDERFIQTSNVTLGTTIKGLDVENTGLKRKHVKKAIQQLNKPLK